MWKTNSKFTSNCLNYCEIFTVYAQFKNVAADYIIQTGGPQVAYP